MHGELSQKRSAGIIVGIIVGITVGIIVPYELFRYTPA